MSSLLLVITFIVLRSDSTDQFLYLAKGPLNSEDQMLETTSLCNLFTSFSFVSHQQSVKEKRLLSHGPRATQVYIHTQVLTHRAVEEDVARVAADAVLVVRLLADLQRTKKWRKRERERDIVCLNAW